MTKSVVDCTIVGAGVVGLSLAYELARRGKSVRLFDRTLPGREASWAGAGILPPANLATSLDPLDQLRGLSHRLHAEWAERLRDETGIDTGYRRCGGIYLVRSVGEGASLGGLAAAFQEIDIEMRRLSPADLASLEPALAPLAESGQLKAAYLLPDEAQLRNPHHLQALIAACRQRGVEMFEHAEVVEVIERGGQAVGVRTPGGDFESLQVCLTAGAWTYRLLHQLGIETGILPIRGQIVLFRCPKQIFGHVLNEGPRYIVPRVDGRVLVGSTEEEVGFDKATTHEAIEELKTLAIDLVSELATAAVERSWAGLRPGSFDGLPYLGRVPELANLFVAAGHFRSGLHLSPGTATALADLMCDAEPTIDLAPFSVGRGLQRLV